ncbi:IS200/IS605 family element transposase accessory protein TnpB [Pseudactinotalea sp. HY160]|uniref:RNA-guided endonuclease InsQ/TnpB family protein n=1 Tax=Pseudactinotalea sp. HY160 TaxID=2654490 RepID=UPI00128BABE9|nr:RNA-guided endonuclease TnpB family protein [Pseudactinotalea sp. HY160]MPV51047.1 IS200/IS605 family element transposase accessory protein TnpB [Pseudactinotalea sp. HY160]
MKKRYTYRAYPTAGQRQMLARTFGCARVVFNDFLAERDRLHREGLHQSVGFGETAKLVTTLAKQTPERAWLSEVSNTPLQQSARDADRAYRNWFNSLAGKRKGPRMGKPRFKSRHDRTQKARFTRNCGFTVRGTTHGVAHVRIPKVGWVRFALSRDLPSDPSSVTVIKEADNTYRVSFVVDTEPAPTSPANPGRAASLDLGLSDYAAIAYSNGTREKIANPRHLRARERKLTRAQRALSRKTRGSNNRDRARIKVARQHRKVREARTDFHHQLAARLIRENQTVAVEALNVVGLSRAGAKGRRGSGLRKSVADAGWGAFLRILEDKATEHGRTYTPVNPAHTSQTCSVCATLDGPKPLGVRVWTCAVCGTRLDRDYNAAVNILVAAGLAETINACGPDVRRTLACAVGDEAGTPRTRAVA